MKEQVMNAREISYFALFIILLINISLGCKIFETIKNYKKNMHDMLLLIFPFIRVLISVDITAVYIIEQLEIIRKTLSAPELKNTAPREKNINIGP